MRIEFFNQKVIKYHQLIEQFRSLSLTQIIQLYQSFEATLSPLQRTQRQLLLRQIFGQTNIKKSRFNTPLSRLQLDIQQSDLSMEILTKEANHSLLSKKIVSYRPQRTDKFELQCSPDQE